MHHNSHWIMYISEKQLFRYIKVSLVLCQFEALKFEMEKILNTKKDMDNLSTS